MACLVVPLVWTVVAYSFFAGPLSQFSELINWLCFSMAVHCDERSTHSSTPNATSSYQLVRHTTLSDVPQRVSQQPLVPKARSSRSQLHAVDYCAVQMTAVDSLPVKRTGCRLHACGCGCRRSDVVRLRLLGVQGDHITHVRRTWLSTGTTGEVVSCDGQ